MDKMNPKEIKTHPTFEALFPINPALLAKIEQDMRDDNYDFSQPIILATWEGQGEPVCIDGHTRLKAAMNAAIEQVPVWLHEFGTEEEAIEKAIKLQRNRRNMTDAELLTCIEVLDKKRARGGDRRSEAEISKRQLCLTENRNPSSAQDTGDLLGISERKVRQTRTVMEHADEGTKEAVRQGDLSINQAYEKTQKKRRKTKPSTPEQERTEQAGSEAESVTHAAEVETWEAEKEYTSTRLNPDHSRILRDLGGSVDEHVAFALDVYFRLVEECAQPRSVG